MIENYLPVLISAAVALAGTGAGFLIQRRSGRSGELNAAIDQFQEQADAATSRADTATARADALQGRVDQLWNEMQELRANYAQQIEWRDGHINQLTQWIYAGKGPPPPARPEGLKQA